MLANKDLWAGVVFIAFGVAAAVVARGYPLGTAARMGPGYFPTALAILLVVLGLAIAIRSVVRARGGLADLWPSWDVRSAVFILLAVLVFAAVVRPLGLIAAVVGSVAVACLGTRAYPLREGVAVIAGLVALTVLLFVWALGLPMQLWPA